MDDKYYRALGVKRGASPAELKSAFRRFAHRYHPDISTEDHAKERFIEIVEAYRALTAENGEPTSDGHTYTKTENAGPAKGKDCYLDVHLSVEELYWGTELKIDPTTTCLGRRSKKGWHNASLLKVKIQRGVQDGARLRLRGKGDSGKNGGEAGDVYLTIRLKSHERYAVRKDNLYVDMPLSTWEAKQGAITDLITPGGRIEVNVPEGISSGQSIRIPHRGLPRPDGEIGDLFAVARLVDIDERTEKKYRWPHISHAGAERWRPTSNRHGGRIDVRV